MTMSKQRVALAGLGALMSGGVAEAEVVSISQGFPKGGVESDIGTTRIVVVGDTESRYNRVANQSLDAWVIVSGNPPENAYDGYRAWASVEGGTIEIRKNRADRSPIPRTTYKVSFPYQDPRSRSVANVRISPVDLCNAELAKRSGEARETFLRDGLTFRQPEAYRAKAAWTWYMHGHRTRTFENETLLSAAITCQSLTGPKVRTQTHTEGAPQQPGQRLPPVVKTATLRIERGPLIDVGRQSCPRSLRLVGFVEVNRPLKGGVIFYGPGFLTPLAEFDLPGDGRRNVIETYPLNWNTPGGLAAGGRERPKSKSVQVRMNVIGSRKQVLERREESIVVTCQFRRMGM